MVIKTFKEFITEEWHASVQNYYSKNKYFDVHKNPSKSELHKIIHHSESKSARGIVHGNDVYVWDAMHGIHDNVADHLGLDVHRRNYISIQKDRYGSEYAGNGYTKHLTDHPWVKKTIPNHRFFHG